MKTSALITFLTKKEQHFVIKRLEKQRDKKMLQAFLWLRNCIDNKHPINRSALYQHLFGVEYDKKKDGKLRNVLRNTNLFIKESLVAYSRMVEKKYFDSDEILWLKRILAAKDFILFEKEWKAITKTQQKAKNFAMLVALRQLYFDYARQNSEISPKKFKELSDFMNTLIGYKKMEFAESIRQLEVKKMLCERVIQAYHPDYIVPPLLSTVQLDALSAQEEIVAYFTLIAQSYAASRDEKIAILLKALTLHTKVLAQRPDIEQNIFMILGTIALEYFLVNDFEQANYYYKQIFTIYDQKRLRPRLDLLFNYVSNLFKSGYYEQVVGIILKNYRPIKNDIRIRYRMEFFLTLSYLFLGENDKAYEELHIHIHERPESEYYSFQMCYLIYYYQTHKEKLFEKEINSLYNRILKHPPQEAHFDYLVRLLKKFARIIFYNPPDKKRTKLQMFQHDIAEYEKKRSDFVHFSINVWLKKEVKNLIGD